MSDQTASPPRDPAIRVMVMPRDTNPHGTIFGGVILSYIDQAGAIEARSHGGHRVVTVALDRVEFHEPVYVGDVLSLYTETVKKGRTSVCVRVFVEALRFSNPGEVVPVTVADITFVAIDKNRNPIPINEPRTP